MKAFVNDVSMTFLFEDEDGWLMQDNGSITIAKHNIETNDAITHFEINAKGFCFVKPSDLAAMVGRVESLAKSVNK
jgi:hypothetical protein